MHQVVMQKRQAKMQKRVHCINCFDDHVDVMAEKQCRATQYKHNIGLCLAPISDLHKTMCIASSTAMYWNILKDIGNALDTGGIFALHCCTG